MEKLSSIQKRRKAIVTVDKRVLKHLIHRRAAVPLPLEGKVPSECEADEVVAEREQPLW